MRASVEEIQAKTAIKCGITLRELLGDSRKRRVAYPRQVAMYLARDLTRNSLPEIGRRFGRDHTTVLHACEQVPTRSEQVSVVAAVRKRLES